MDRLGMSPYSLPPRNWATFASATPFTLWVTISPIPFPTFCVWMTFAWRLRSSISIGRSKTVAVWNGGCVARLRSLGISLREAEQNRAPEIRLGQEIANRTRLYFYDYLEDISADIPGVESWKEPFSDKLHYHWRPQKDCFYLDENIDDYLRELYEFVRMKYNY